MLQETQNHSLFPAEIYLFGSDLTSYPLLKRGHRLTRKEGRIVSMMAATFFRGPSHQYGT